MTAQVTIVGNLTREPEIRYTTAGVATTTLGIAVNRRWKHHGSEEAEEEASFFDVVCFNELAENVALSITKGMRVVIPGRLSMRSWSDEDGRRRTKVEVVADDVAPSLRFATASVSRIARSDDDAPF
jgi:single-strand DNA-binding protein